MKTATALLDRPVAAVTAPVVTPEQLELVKQTVAQGATDAELKLYLYDCQRQGVHPLDKLLHFVKRSGRYVPVTSIDLMRSRAADTGEYAGSDDAAFGGVQKTDEWAATVTVWRLVQGVRCAFTATARWSEYRPDAAAMWNRMPHTMLGKCAEALALRKGFPRQLAGVYAQEEMAQAERQDVPFLDAAPSAPTMPVVDVATGEQVAPEAPLPTPPAGYFYVSGYRFNDPWHEASLLRYDAQGGALKVSTKRGNIGVVLAEAQGEGVPVRAGKLEPKANRPGEAYIGEVTKWKAEKTGPKLALRPAPLEVVGDEDIPF